MSVLTRRQIMAAGVAAAALAGRPAFANFLPTPSGAEGPFYPVEILLDHDNDLVRVVGAVREAGGKILDLTGTLRSSAGAAIANAPIEIWQCDAGGVYLHPSDRRIGARDTGFQGFGRALTNGDGQFRFRTIVPVPYPGRTPHIHLKALAPNQQPLTTQYYVDGDPGNARDFLFRRLNAAARPLVSMNIIAVGDGTFATSIDATLW